MNISIEQWMSSETSASIPEGLTVIHATPEDMARVRITARMDRQDLARNMRSLRAAGKSTGTLDDLANI